MIKMSFGPLLNYIFENRGIWVKSKKPFKNAPPVQVQEEHSGP